MNSRLLLSGRLNLLRCCRSEEILSARETKKREENVDFSLRLRRVRLDAGPVAALALTGTGMGGSAVDTRSWVARKEPKNIACGITVAPKIPTAFLTHQQTNPDGWNRLLLPVYIALGLLSNSFLDGTKPRNTCGQSAPILTSKIRKHTKTAAT